MVENGSKSHRCRFCNSTFSENILTKIKAGKDDVYCENCGDIIKRIRDDYSSNPNPTETKQNETKPNMIDESIKPQVNSKAHPDALNYQIGRIFYDADFSPSFKENFIIVFSRLVCFHALYLEREGQIKLGEPFIPENALNDLYMSTRDIQNRRIQPEFLNNLHEISNNEFERNLRRLQAKIQSKREYLEDFHVYTRWLIREVYILISNEVPIDDLPKFERTIICDLKKFELLAHYKLKITQNKTITHLNKPTDLVKHYFEEFGKCCFNRKLTKNRHNYSIKNKSTLFCLDCSKFFENKEFSESIITLNNRYLKKLEDSKRFGDVTIYRAYFARTIANGNKKWLSFPGIGYEGQTIEKARERIYYGHIKNAFDVKKKHTYFENSIKKNFIIKEIARKYVRYKILQIIRFQGDIDMIWNIENPNVKKAKLEEAINSTQRLADNAEKFWIGYYKTQFKEFGRNIEEGGKENRMVLIDSAKLDESIRKNMHVRRSQGPFEKIKNELNTTRAILVKNILYYYGKSLEDVKHKMLLTDTQKLFELGYVAKNIAIKLKLEGKIENGSKTVGDWIRNEIYINRFPEKPKYRRIRDKVLSEIIEKKIKEGRTTLKSLLTALPGFEVPGETFRERSWELKRFVSDNLGGIKKIIKKYHNKPKKDYLSNALLIIKDYYKNKKRLSAVKLAFELGFCQDFGYTEASLRKNAASRYIPQHTGKTMKELIEIALTS